MFRSLPQDFVCADCDVEQLKLIYKKRLTMTQKPKAITLAKTRAEIEALQGRGGGMELS